MTERASKGPGEACKACNCRKFDWSLGQKRPLMGKTRLAAARSPISMKSSFLESYRRALQATVNRRIQIELKARAVALAARERGTTKRLLKSPRRALQKSRLPNSHEAVAGAIHATHWSGVPRPTQFACRLTDTVTSLQRVSKTNAAPAGPSRRRHSSLYWSGGGSKRSSLDLYCSRVSKDTSP